MLTVLIVDDVSLFRLGIKASIKRIKGARVWDCDYNKDEYPQNYDICVLEAQTSSSAISIIDNNDVDLIFLDLDLGSDPNLSDKDKDGMEIAKYVSEEGKNIKKIVMLSGNVSESYVYQGFKYGVTDVLKKPASPDKIMQYVSDMLNIS